MAAEPVQIVPLDDGNFTSEETKHVVIGPCLCPGRPHDEDTAEVYREPTWEVLIDVGTLATGAAYRRLVVGTLASWNLVDADGDPVPVSQVVRLKTGRLDAIAGAVNEAYDRAKEPLPNASGAPSRRPRRESASPNPTIRPRARRGR